MSVSKKRRRYAGENRSQQKKRSKGDQGDLAARRIFLREVEKDNLTLRKTKFDLVLKKGIKAFAREMARQRRKKLSEKIGSLPDIVFDLDLNRTMLFIDNFTGVKPRNEPNVCWDEKVSRNWLNRQRAAVYSSTLFCEMCTHISDIADHIASLDPKIADWLRYVVKRKLFPDVLGATYKPKSKQAAEKKLICSNAAKDKEFVRHVMEILGWDHLNDVSLEGFAVRCEQEYEQVIGQPPTKKLIIDDDATLDKPFKIRRGPPVDEDRQIPPTRLNTEGFCIKSLPSTSSNASSSDRCSPAYSEIQTELSETALFPPQKTQGVWGSFQRYSRDQLMELCTRLTSENEALKAQLKAVRMPQNMMYGGMNTFGMGYVRPFPALSQIPQFIPQEAMGEPGHPPLPLPQQIPDFSLIPPFCAGGVPNALDSFSLNDPSLISDSISTFGSSGSSEATIDFPPNDYFMCPQNSC